MGKWKKIKYFVFPILFVSMIVIAYKIGYSRSERTDIWAVGGGSYGAAVDSSGNILPFADDTSDLGSSTYEYQDGYFDGTVYCDALSNSGAFTQTGAMSVAGLSTLTGGLSLPVSVKADSATLTSSDYGVVICTKAGKAQFTLPVSTAVAQGAIYTIKQTGGAHVLTVATAVSGDKIDGSDTNTSMDADNDCITIYNDSARNEWLIIQRYIQ